MNSDKITLWREVLGNIKVSVSSAIFSTWFSQTHIASLQKNDDRFLVEVGCNSTFIKSTLESRYFGLVLESLEAALEEKCDLLFLVKQAPDKKSIADEDQTPLFSSTQEDAAFLSILKSSKINPGFSFENFAVSSSNQMAHAAAEAVAKNPGSAYNPLFLWGGVGVGKTHLMNAVGLSIIAGRDDVKAVLCTGEDFTNDIVEGIRNKTTQGVRAKYRKLDALLIDDIQFIAGKDAVQVEFFHTFNAVTSSHGQIILTSDRPPAEISKLEERLRSRFEAGLIVDIAPSDFELRCAILQIKCKERGMEIPMNEIQLIAANLETARKIEGFLVRLTSELNLKHLEINEDLIKSLLEKGGKAEIDVVKSNPVEVISAVSKYFSLGKRALLGTSRARPVARPRQILMYLLRTQLGLPYQEVGRLIGGRDHSTVMHAVDKITHLASSDVQIREDLLGIKRAL